MDVRAAVAVAAGKPLEVTTVQLDGPRAGEVLVEIKATGICHTDAFTLSGGVARQEAVVQTSKVNAQALCNLTRIMRRELRSKCRERFCL
jgi:NADPH:quinone reductase-like Zn-dependent oxidoreductase